MTVTTAPPRPKPDPARGTAPKEPGFGARYALVLVALVWAAHLMAVIGLLAGNAQSDIAIHFRTTDIAWFTLSSALVGTFVTPFVVKAAGVYGKKRVMVVITGIGLVGDVIAATATGYGTLILGRAVAGVFIPAGALAYALTRDVFPRHLVGPASGLLGGSVGLVAVGGPFLSAWLIDDFGFRGALWFMVVATAFSLVAMTLFVPESPVREERTPVDWAGGLLLGGGLTAAVYGLGEGSDWGWTSGRTFAFVGGGLLALVAFVVVEGRVAHPMFPLSLLSRRPVWTTLLATSLAAGTAYTVGTVLYLLALMPGVPGFSDGLGFSATKNAVINVPSSVLVLVVAVTTGALARRIDARRLLSCGSLLFAIAFALTAQFHHSATHLMLVGIVGALGLGMIVAVVPILVIEAVSPQEQALGNGAQSMMQGIVQAVVLQVTFVVMARDGAVHHDVLFYRDAGFTNAFWVISGVALLAAGAALLIPRRTGLDEVDAGQAEPEEDRLPAES
ncbi:MFS transporter [Yinghuangia sp. ASG 101]|uniref:MFS transporter n=1 Tax=Yinghuangia sp. ASG 101 TaxID=2896848 RepID=UPI001E37DC2B|nr:MFS transporter [Yinghuangia sp. ASG 101]UGQ10859.1 MFS transporter [Yinghuangia sp. ASG 101]